MLGRQHKIKSSDLRFAARIVQGHVTMSKPAQNALHVKSYTNSLFSLIQRLELAAAYEEQIDRPGDEHPPNGIDVLALWPDGWVVSYHIKDHAALDDGWRKGGQWQAERTPISWRELPPVSEGTP